jgi:decaprenyl-phosphate phosphoribosyltransferase
MNAYLRAMRLERWPRSLAIFLGTAAYFFFHRDALAEFPIAELAWRTAAAFLLTWAISTANYILNEIVDLPFDVHHPTKRNRPLVQGEIRKGPFALMGFVLIVAALGLSYVLFARPFFFSSLALFAAGIVYNVRPIRTKDIAFLDSISESANNPIRFLIGWYAFAALADRPPVSLLLSWWAFGNFLMVAKRLSEFRYLKDKAGDYRLSHKMYSRGSLLFGMIASGAICLLAFVYLGARFHLVSFYGIAPFLFVFFGMILRKTLGTDEVMEEPEKLLASPKYALFALFLVTLFVLSYVFDPIIR